MASTVINGFSFPGVTFSQIFERQVSPDASELAVAIVGDMTLERKIPLITNGVPAGGSVVDVGTAFSATYSDVVDAKVADSEYRINLTVDHGVYGYLDLAASDITSAAYSSNQLTFGSAITGSAGKFAGMGSKNVVAGDPVYVEYADSCAIVEVTSVGTSSIKYNGTLDSGFTGVALCVYRDAAYSGVVTGTSVVSSNAVAEASGTSGTLNLLKTSTYKAYVYSNNASDVLEATLKQFDSTGDLTASVPYRPVGELCVVGTLSELDDIVCGGSSETSEYHSSATVYQTKGNDAIIAARMALLAGRNTEAGTDTPVYMTCPQDSATPAAYAQALDFLAKWRGIYSIVPVAPASVDDEGIIRECSAVVYNQSTDKSSKIRRALWYGVDSTRQFAADIRDDVIAQRKARTNNERAVCVWADGIIYAGRTIPNRVAAAAAAGMRAYEPCQRPLSNLAYPFLGVSDDHGLTESQLKLIGSNGIWIIAQNDAGAVINKRQVTTAVANSLNMDEESIVSNADSVALSMVDIGEDMVGNSNISPTLLALLEDMIRVKMDRCLVNTTGSALIGPQLLAWELVNLWQDTVNMDHVYAEFTITPPRPFNQFHMIMRVL